MAHVIITRNRARQDVRDQVAWLQANRTVTIAGRWLIRYDIAIRSIGSDPFQYPEADEAAELDCNLRQASFRFGRSVYRILFTIQDETVNILRIRHAAQDHLSDADI